MASLNRVRVHLGGFPGSPGVMTFVCMDAPALMDPLHTWLNLQAARMPAPTTIDIQGDGDVFESTTGTVTGTWSATPPANITCLTVDTYAAGVGALVHWKTDTYLSGRLLRGRSFIVPITRGVFATDGTLTPESRAALTTEANAFVTSVVGNLAVWQRPRVAKPADGSRRAITARGGGHATVVTAVVPDRGVFLTSRRP